MRYLTGVDAQHGGTWVVPFSPNDMQRRNPRGPADGMDDSAPIPGEEQMIAPAGSIFIQDSRCWVSARIAFAASFFRSLKKLLCAAFHRGQPLRLCAHRGCGAVRSWLDER